MERLSGIAIIGMDCRFPGSNSITEYWNNLINLRQQFREIPSNRLDLDYYFSETNPDMTYCKHAAILTNYYFDRLKYKIPKDTFEQTDIAHWLTLDVTYAALKDSSFENGIGLNKEKTGVIIGNSLTSEFSRSNLLRLRWPYIYKTILKVLSTKDIPQDKIDTFLKDVENAFKHPFPIPNADTLAGGLSNTIAGRICNYFDFNGGGFTIDGACSSSLLALVKACEALRSHELDVAIAGGVDLSIDPFELVGFARTNALATNEMNVFSNSPNGFWPGEGCGIVVLMREEEAKDMNLKIYSIIKGWGISSDGRGSLTRPKIETQKLAISKAYQMAGYSLSSVSMIEAHGTGTPIGDEVELASIIDLLKNERELKSPIIIDSVKHLIGHTKAASGIAGVIKGALCTYNNIIPPSIINKQPHKLLIENSKLIIKNDKIIEYVNSNPFRIGISSFGFGGINVHITIEKNKKISNEYLINRNNMPFRDYEIFPIYALTKDEFILKIKKIKSVSKNISRAEFIDFSLSYLKFKTNANYRACIVADSPNMLIEKIDILLESIKNNKKRLLQENLYFNICSSVEKIGYLFPGQAMPIYNDNGIYRSTPNLVDIFHRYKNEYNVNSKQSMILLNNLSSIELLKKFGIKADYTLGYSLGEISALNYAGGISVQDMFNIVSIREDMLLKYGEKDGSMLVVNCSLSEVKELIKTTRISITGYNSSMNYTLGGNINEIQKVKQMAFEKKIPNVQLKVAYAFHTSMIVQAAMHFRDLIKKIKPNELKGKVISTLTGSFLPESFDLSQHLFNQMVEPVQFYEAIMSLKEKVSVFFEIGSGSALTNMIKKEKDIKVIPLDFRGHTFNGLLNIISAAFTLGHDINFTPYLENRFHENFNLNKWSLISLTNPCELNEEEKVSHIYTEEKLKQKPEYLENSFEYVLDYILNLISSKLEIPRTNINPGDRVMSELHINSLAIVEILSFSIKKFKKSNDVFAKISFLASSDATIREISKEIFYGETLTNDINTINFEKLPNWTHVFNKKLKKLKIVPFAHESYHIREIHLVNEINYEIESDLIEKLSHLCTMAIYIYSSSTILRILDFYEFINSLYLNKIEMFVLIDINNGNLIVNDLKPILRSFHQEHSQIRVLSIELYYLYPEMVFELIKKFFFSSSKYKEFICDKNKICHEAYFEAIFPKISSYSHKLTEKDVLLASGGGKGITFKIVENIATQTRCKIILLGRSNPEQDRDLKFNLSILNEAGVDIKYYSADVLNKNVMKNIIKEVTAEFGPITAIIHGAGINLPCKICDINSDNFYKTLAVKTYGLENIIDCIDKSKLRYLIGLGSAISEIGMQGNSDYAYANDQLALYIDKFGIAYQNCKCITLEYSVWEDIGMGISLKSIRFLKEQGIFPIPFRNALNSLKYLLCDPKITNGRYLITGRMRNIPTLKYRQSTPNLLRFTLNIRNFTPDIEIVSDVNINTDTDIYLNHHIFRGQYIYPVAFILEGIAQICKTICHDISVYSFEKLKINKSIFIQKDKDNIIRFIATRTIKNEIFVVVQSEDSNFEINCFECQFIINYKKEFLPENITIYDKKIMNFNVENSFYNDLLFHTGLFRRIKSFYEISSTKSFALADLNKVDKLYGNNLPELNLLGDPGLNDAAIHCHQACRPLNNLLPVGFDKLYFNPNIKGDEYFIHTEEVAEYEDETIINVYVFNRQREIKSAWKQLKLKTIKDARFAGEWISYFLLPMIEYKIKHIFKEHKEIQITLEDCDYILNKFKNDCDQVVISKKGWKLFFDKIDNSLDVNDYSFDLSFNSTNNIHIKMSLICQ